MSPTPSAAKLRDSYDDSDIAEDDFGRTRADLAFWINAVGAPVVVMRKHDLIARGANESAENFFGIDAADFDDCPVERIVGANAAHMLGQIWSNAPDGVVGKPFVIRSIVRGHERLLLVHVSRMNVEGETVRLFTFTDAPPEGSVALAGWQENITALLNWLPFGFEIASTDDQIQFANQQFHELFGYSQHEISNIEDWWRLCYPDPEYREHAKQLWHNSIADARAEDREMTPFTLDVTTKTGALRAIQFRHRTINNFNVNLYLDMTRERAYERELEMLAHTDPLTGAMNRRHFFAEAERLCRSDKSGPLAVLMLDIDHFKRINDAHGHSVGDMVLTEFTDRCRKAIRGSDFLARMGGEEFIVLLNGANDADIRTIGENLRRAVNGTLFEAAGVSLPVSVSIGASARLSAEPSLEPAILRADKALYEAKQTGRDRLVIGELLPDA